MCTSAGEDALLFRFIAAFMTARMLHMRFGIVIVVMRDKPRIGLTFVMIVEAELSELPLRRAEHRIGWEHLPALKLLLAAPLVFVDAVHLNRLAGQRRHFIKLLIIIAHCC